MSLFSVNGGDARKFRTIRSRSRGAPWLSTRYRRECDVSIRLIQALEALLLAVGVYGSGRRHNLPYRQEHLRWREAPPDRSRLGDCSAGHRLRARSPFSRVGAYGCY